MCLIVMKARSVAHLLHDAATQAVSIAKADEESAWQAFRTIPSIIPATVNMRDVQYCQYNRCRLLQQASPSIVSCRNALEGLIWLAALDYRRGIRLFELGVRSTGFETANLDADDPQVEQVRAANRVLREGDLVALRDLRKVEPGLFERVFEARIQHSAGVGYMSGMLLAYAQVSNDVAASLERGLEQNFNDSAVHFLEPTFATG